MSRGRPGLRSQPIRVLDRASERIRDMQSAAVQQAIGVLMDWYEVPPDAAIEQLQNWSGDCGVPLDELATGLVQGICLGRPTRCPQTTIRHLEQLLRQLPEPASPAG
jgi:ANTAR domain-containing protein